jgi:hypothetical protein
MRALCSTRLRHSAALLSLVAVVACGNDDGTGTGEDTSTGGDTSTTVAPTSTTAPMTTEPMETSSSEGASASADESSSTGEAEVTILGRLRDLPAFTPIEGAEVSVIDMPGLETTTDADGMCSIGPVPAGTAMFVEIAPTDTYFGSVIGLTATPGDEEQDLAQISYMTVEGQIEILQDMMPAEADLTQAIVVVRLGQESLEGVSIEMEPAPDPAAFYSPDAMGAVVLGKNLIEFGLLPVVVYFNIAPSAAGDIVVTALHDTATCTVVHPDFPTLAEHVTLVDVDCVE